ncbi:MAG: putative metal-binding motif-containing protein [Anaerolineae bacterium]|nr:putative metal-binding motif-containing protein [Anaerolineae bacterium]
MTRRRLSIVALFVAMVGILVIPSTIVAQQGQERVSICHRDGRGQFHLITIAVSAVPAHLAHGDHFPQPFYVDSDGDGFGNPADTVTACVAPDGYVTNGNDCDDSNAAINPGQPEVCNGLVDEGVTITLYRDADGDGYGNPDVSIQACTTGNGYVTNADDCDDSNAAINPGQPEVCNGLDDNCNGLVDEGVTITLYRDADNDGYGNPDASIQACTMESGYVSNGDDCDDSNAAINPGQPEVCNGLDDNCNGLVDEGVTITLYRDADNDGYGNPDASIQACTIENGYVTNADDCYDENPWAFPGQTEWFTEGRGDWYWEGGDWYWSYDYDCSGLEEQQWTDLYGGSCYQLNWWSPTCSSIQPGWQDSIPECGNVGVWVIGCYWVGYPDFCSLGIGYRQQACH